MDNSRKPKGALRAFLSYYRPHMGLFSLDMACALFIAAIDLAFPLASRYAMSELLPNKAYEPFFIIMGAFALVYLLRSVLDYVVTYWGHTLGVRMEADMRRDLFTHLQTLSFRFYDRNRTGQLMSRVTTDLFDITELAHHGPEDFFIAVLTILGAFIVMLTISWPLALVLMVLVPVGVGFMLLQRGRMMSASQKVKERTAGINAGLESSISGARVAKAFTNESYEIDKFMENNEQFKRSKGEYYSAMGVFASGMGFFTNVFNLAVIAVGGYLIMQNHFDYIGLVTFTLYVGTFLQPIRRLTNFMEAFTSGAAGFKRFRELLSEQPDITDAPGAQPLRNVRGDIEFDGVSFAYNDHTQVLSGLSLRIGAGRTLALVGPSGGGKTTLCHLIPPLLRGHGGQHPHRRARHPGRDAAVAAAEHRHRVAGRISLRGQRKGEHPLWPRGCHRRRDRRGSKACRNPRHDHGDGERLRYAGGRARRAALRRAEAAHRHRAHLSQEPAHTDTRRGDLRAGHHH